MMGPAGYGERSQEESQSPFLSEDLKKKLELVKAKWIPVLKDMVEVKQETEHEQQELKSALEAKDQKIFELEDDNRKLNTMLLDLKSALEAKDQKISELEDDKRKLNNLLLDLKVNRPCGGIE